MGFIGVIFWTIGMGSQQSLMRAIVGNLTPRQQRGSAYGIFNFAYGVSWFLGSVLLGWLYDQSVLIMVIIVFILQFASLPWLVIVLKKLYAKKSTHQHG